MLELRWKGSVRFEECLGQSSEANTSELCLHPQEGTVRQAVAGACLHQYWEVLTLLPLNKLLISTSDPYLLKSPICERVNRNKTTAENHHHFCRYLLQVLQRLKSHLSALSAAQAHLPCAFSGALNQLQNLQELLKTQILPREEGPCR